MSSDKSKRYEKIDFLGEGQFATVYKAKDIFNNEKIVAVKKIKLGSRQEAADGINRTALREIKLLQELSHPNLIGLLDSFGQRSNISLVFDFMDTDLEVLIKDNSVVFTLPHIKAYVLQTLKGLEYLHSCWILHRDIKPNNLLINNDGVLKIGDFGLAKFFGSPNRIYTHQVVTRWYRCPELLFGARNYGTGVDIWATGCVLAEMLLRVPFIPGDSDLDQLNKIFTVFGTPNDHTWPGVTKLHDYIQFKHYPPQPLNQIFSAAMDDLLMLLQSMFEINPNNRGTSTECLKMSYFSNKPNPTVGQLLPKAKSMLSNNNTTKPSLKRKLQESDENVGLVKKLVF